MSERTINRLIAAAFLVTLCVTFLTLSGCGEAVAINPVPDKKLVEQLRAGGGSTGAEDAAADAKSTGTGWGTLKGKFIYAGDPPKPGFLSTAGKDPTVCGQQVPIESLIVDPSTKGLANVVIYARKVPRVFKEEGEAADSKAVFDQKNCLFLTHVMAMRTSDPLVMKNSDSVSHNINMTPRGSNGFNQTLTENATASYQFAKQLAEPVDATCSIHPWMKAYIIARDDPYFAVSTKDGSFEIKNLPAGEDIEFQVWHEQATQGLQAKADWPRGRFKIQVPVDGVQDLQVIEVPPTALR